MQSKIVKRNNYGQIVVRQNEMKRFASPYELSLGDLTYVTLSLGKEVLDLHAKLDEVTFERDGYAQRVESLLKKEKTVEKPSDTNNIRRKWFPNW